MDDSLLLKNLKFEETEAYEKGFSDYFEKKIKHELQPLEELRIEKVEETEKRKGWAPIIVAIAFGVDAILFFAGFFHSTRANSHSEGAVFAIPLITLFLVYGYIHAPENAYQAKVREILVPLLLSFFGEMRYDTEGKIGEEFLKASDIIYPYNDYSSLDFVHGDYKNTGFEIESASLTRGSGKHVSLVFGGKILLLKMKKTFQGKTIVKKDQGFFGNWDDRRHTKLEQIKLEDPRFEKVFEVYSTDQVEARYLLTPAFMDRLVDLAAKFRSDSIQASFFDDFLLITFSNATMQLVNLFQPGGLEESIINTEEIHEFLSQIRGLLSIIDILNLSSETGM